MESSQKVKEEEGLSPEENVGAEIKKFCSDCKTTITPLWRSGPSGPKSLCNACGIRHRKMRPAIAGAAATAAAVTTKSGGKKEKVGKTKNLMPLGKEVEVVEGRRKAAKTKNLMPLGKEVEVVEGRKKAAKRLKSPRQWGEVEKAALLLMAMSCGAVFD